MAISTSFEQIRKKFIPQYWDSIDSFEEYYLRELSERLPDTNYYTNREGKEITIPPINHSPNLELYEVWIEGYAATGEHETASLLGKAKARNFAQACHMVMATKFLERTRVENSPEYKQYSTSSQWSYDPSTLSSWGCRLYWNEELARKSFG